MYYGLFLISLLITTLAQFYVNVSYNKYNKINLSSGETGADIARTILDKAGLKDVSVYETSGFLSDHYHPSKKAVFLSSKNYYGSSIGSASVAAHECGHAIQHKEGYIFMNIRSAIVPFVNFASYLGYIAITLGFILELFDLIWLGILAECAILGFQLVTLPVEFNASSRALNILKTGSYLTEKEIKGSKTVLRAAALTYVASVATNLIEIFRLVLLAGGRRND